MKKLILILSLVFAYATALQAQEVSKAADGSAVYIVSPQNGETVSSPVKVVFGLSGMGIAPAGSDIANTGHHHLIIDAPLPDLAEPIPASDNYKHFGKGQTETSVELSPGQHTLQLLLGDWLHRPHENPVASEVVTITVK